MLANLTQGLITTKCDFWVVFKTAHLQSLKKERALVFNIFLQVIHIYPDININK